MIIYLSDFPDMNIWPILISDAVASGSSYGNRAKSRPSIFDRDSLLRHQTKDKNSDKFFHENLAN